MTTRSTPTTPPSELDKALKDLGIKERHGGHGGSEEIWGLCPMHEERTGSPDKRPNNWSVNKNTGWHHCFACGYRGSLQGLVMDLVPSCRNDVFAAQRWLRKYGMRALEDLEADLESIEDEEEDEGLRTYKGRLTKVEAKFAAFPDPPKKVRESRRLSLEACQAYDVRWDPENEWWIIPIYGPDGSFWGWQEKGKGYFWNRPPKVPKKETLFGITRFEEGSWAYLVESPLDAVRLLSVGYEGAVASYGVHVSDEQMRLISDRTDDVVIALDNDAEGRLKSDALRRTWGRKLNLWFLDYTKAVKKKDIGEMTNKQIRRAVSNAKFSVEAVLI